MTSPLLRLLIHRRSVREVLARKVVQALSLFSYTDRLSICAVERPHYGHCLWEAAKLAARLGYPKISAIEFGCGGGNGLLNAEMHIAQIERLFPVEFELYGFDTGEGLPPTDDYRDFPYYFKPGAFRMDRQRLQSKVMRAKLILGDAKETCKTFFDKYGPAPVGCIFHDLDFYSSTRDAFCLFDEDSAHFLPRIFMYFDDLNGDNSWLISEYAGELLAIEEFNKDHVSKKIAANRAMPIMYSDQWWVHQIFIYHDFKHPKYNEFIADEEQRRHEAGIALR